jgi:hypothetical protein
MARAFLAAHQDSSLRPSVSLERRSAPVRTDCCFARGATAVSVVGSAFAFHANERCCSSAALRDTQHSSGRREPSGRTGSRGPRQRCIRARSKGSGPPAGVGDAGREGTPSRCRKSSAAGRCDSPALPRQRPPADAPGRTRTCDPLLRRREHLLRSTAACRSACVTSDGPHIAAAVYCGLPLP